MALCVKHHEKPPHLVGKAPTRAQQGLSVHAHWPYVITSYGLSDERSYTPI